LSKKWNAEFREKKIKEKAGQYVNPRRHAFKVLRNTKAVKEYLLNKRELELKSLIPELVKKCKKVPDLEACSEDIRHILNFCIEIMGVKAKDCKLLVHKDLFDLVVKRVLR
jgi:hypothetical protein